MNAEKGVSRTLTVLTPVLRAGLYLLAAITAVEFAASFMRFVSPARLKTQEAIAAGAGSTLNAVFEFTHRLEMWAALIVLIPFLVWVYAAKAGTIRLGAEGQRITPVWAVIWYFIPIANFYKPVQNMEETWQASANPSGWREQALGILSQRWTFLFLAAIASRLFLVRTGGKMPSPEQTQMLGVALNISLIVQVMFYVVTAFIIQEICMLQAEAWRRKA